MTIVSDPAASIGRIGEETSAPPVLRRRRIVADVVRRGGPRLVESSILPTALFWACLALGSLGAAYAAALVWTYGCVVRRLLRRDQVTGVLVLASVGITVRTALAVGSGSSFVYFAQPVIGAVLTGCVFLGSIVVGRPLIGKLAHDFWPITPEQAALPSVQRLMRGLTALWAGVNLATAATTFVLLRSLSLGTFVAAKQVTGWAITATAVAITIGWAHRTAGAEGIIATTPRRGRRRRIGAHPVDVLPAAA